MSKYKYYRSLNDKSFKLLRKIYHNDIRIINNVIFKDPKHPLIINNKMMIVINNQVSITSRRKNKSLYDYLNFYTSFYQREWYIHKFINIENVTLCKRSIKCNKNTWYIYTIQSNSNGKILRSYISKYDNNKKFIKMIERYYNL